MGEKVDGMLVTAMMTEMGVCSLYCYTLFSWYNSVRGTRNTAHEAEHTQHTHKLTHCTLFRQHTANNKLI